MLNIFVSWSGERSKLFAESLCYWIPRVHNHLKPWMSKQIPKGSRWRTVVGERLEETEVGLLCVTPENTSSPWLMFEAGALSKRLESSRVCPVLYELKADDLVSPLDQFQAVEADREDITRLLLSLNSLLGENALSQELVEEAVKSNWGKFQRKLAKIQQCKVPANMSSITSIIEALSKGGFKEPVHTKQAYFDNGYETYELYSIVTKIAKKRLLIFGRKNRKLFDRTEYLDFFKTLSDKMAQGFDFRVLFLDPQSTNDLIARSSYDTDFHKVLNDSVMNATKMLSNNGIKPGEVCKFYSAERTCGMMVVDNAVLCATLKHDSMGRVERTTDSAFSVVNTYSSCGEQLLETFEHYWRLGRALQ